MQQTKKVRKRVMVEVGVICTRSYIQIYYLS